MRMVRVAMMSKVNDATANAFGVIPMLCDGDVGMWIGLIGIINSWIGRAQNNIPRGSILLFGAFSLSPC